MGRNVMIVIITVLLFFSRTDVVLAGTQIIINKAINQLHYLQDGEVLKTFPVATGKHPSYTPEGDFTVVVKLVNPYYSKLGIPGGSPQNPLGVRWLGLSIGGGGVYGIHGTNNPASIGTYASAGCIRMHNRDVIWLYDHTSVGTPVKIINTPEAPQPVPILKPVTVIFEDRQVVINNPLQGMDGAPLLPLRTVFELLGYSVTWDAVTSTVYLRKGAETITVNYLTNRVTTGSKVVEGQKIKINGGTVHAPVTLWENTLTNMQVDWDPETLIISFCAQTNRE